jgi:hypothetical protein
MELSLGLALRTALRVSLALASGFTGVAPHLHAQTPPAPTPAPTTAGPGGAMRTTPPEVRTGLRLPEIQLHDPWILADRSTRTYYLYSSASPRITGKGRTGTLYYTSKDLATWEGPRIAFVAPESSWADPRVGAWAPEVHEYQGKYWLFTTLHNPAKRLATTDTTRPNLMRATVIAVSD